MDDLSDVKSVPKEPYKCAIGSYSQIWPASKDNITQLQMSINQNNVDVHSMSGVHSYPSKRVQLIPYDQSSISVTKEKTISNDEDVSDQQVINIETSNQSLANAAAKPLAKVIPLVNSTQPCHCSVQTDALSIDLDSLMHLEDLSRSQRILGLKSKHYDSLIELDESFNQTKMGEKQQSDYLINKNQELEMLLKTQLKVNSDLKKLLLSSVGEDCTRICEDMSKECCQLRSDLSNSRLELIQLQEKYDQLNIEVDMWRSKFIAGRVMVEELASWKSRLSNRYSESVTTLQVLAQEMNQMFDDIKSMHQTLLDCQDPPQSAPTGANMLELTTQCKHLLDKTLSDKGFVRKPVHAHSSVIPSQLPTTKQSSGQDKVISTHKGSVAGHFVSMMWRQLCSSGMSSAKLSGVTSDDQSIPIQLNCSNSSTQTNVKRTKPVSIIRDANIEHNEHITLGEKLLHRVLYQHSLLANDPTYRYQSGYNSPSSQTFERLSDSCKKCRGEITVL